MKIPMKILTAVMTAMTATGKSMSEALIFASINPLYDSRLFIELQEKYTLRTCLADKLLLIFVLILKIICVQNMF